MILLAIALLQVPFAVNGPPQVSQAEVSPFTSPSAPHEPPLKCGEHQHVDHWPGNCGPSPCDSIGGCSAVVHVVYEVTEKEWLAIMDRLEKLEQYTYCFSHACVLSSVQ